MTLKKRNSFFIFGSLEQKVRKNFSLSFIYHTSEENAKPSILPLSKRFRKFKLLKNV